MGVLFYWRRYFTNLVSSPFLVASHAHVFVNILLNFVVQFLKFDPYPYYHSHYPEVGNWVCLKKNPFPSLCF